MDPPDLFSDLYDDDAHEIPRRMPQERRSPVARTPPPGGVPAARTKDASVLLPTDPRMRDALRIAELRQHVVTSGAEGSPADRVHAPTSQHYEGLAIDVRFAGNRELQAQLYRGAGYVAIVEKDHLHVQRYPKTV